MQVREKVEKSRNTVFFQWFVVPEGRRVGSLKRRVRSHLARCEIKKLHAVVARSTFGSQNVKKLHVRTTTPLWREAHFQVKMYQAHRSRTTFGSWHVEKVHAVVARSTFPSQKCKKLTGTEHFWTFRCRFAWQAQGIVHLVKISKTWSFVAFPKTMAGVGHLKRICKDAFSVAGAVQETCSSEMLGGPGAGFLERVAFWNIRSSVLGRWFCVTGAALCMTRHHFFVTGAIVQIDGLEKSQNALVRGRLCTQLSIFERRLAELLRFWCWQLQALR